MLNQPIMKILMDQKHKLNFLIWHLKWEKQRNRSVKIAESFFSQPLVTQAKKQGGGNFFFPLPSVPLSNVPCNKFINVFLNSTKASCQLIKMAMANSNKRLSLDGHFLMASQIAISDHERGRWSSGGFCAQEAELGAKEEVKGRQWLEGGIACLPLGGGALCHRFPRLFLLNDQIKAFCTIFSFTLAYTGWSGGGIVDQK